MTRTAALLAVLSIALAANAQNPNLSGITKDTDMLGAAIRANPNFVAPTAAPPSTRRTRPSIPPSSGPLVTTGLTGPVPAIGISADLVVTVTPNSQISQSSEAVNGRIPVRVWRSRQPAGGGAESWCVIEMMSVSVSTSPQVFTIPAADVRRGDAILFEWRPWYRLTVAGYDFELRPSGTGVRTLWAGAMSCP